MKRECALVHTMDVIIVVTDSSSLSNFNPLQSLLQKKFLYHFCSFLQAEVATEICFSHFKKIKKKKI